MQALKKHSFIFLTIALFAIIFPIITLAQTGDFENLENNYGKINEMQEQKDAAERVQQGRDCKGFVCCSEGYNCDFDAVLYNLGYIIKKILEYAFVFMALMFAFAGFKYIKSSGNPSAIAEAHSMFKKAILGTLIVLLSFLIVELITSALGLEKEFVELIK